MAVPSYETQIDATLPALPGCIIKIERCKRFILRGTGKARLRLP